MGGVNPGFCKREDRNDRPAALYYIANRYNAQGVNGGWISS